MSPQKTIREIRRFGLVMAAAFGGLGVFFFLKDASPAYYFGGIAALFLILAVFIPELLRPVEKWWMVLAEKLSIVFDIHSADINILSYHCAIRDLSPFIGERPS